jgi:hypothetical protein
MKQRALRLQVSLQKETVLPSSSHNFHNRILRPSSQTKNRQSHVLYVREWRTIAGSQSIDRSTKSHASSASYSNQSQTTKHLASRPANQSNLVQFSSSSSIGAGVRRSVRLLGRRCRELLMLLAESSGAMLSISSAPQSLSLSSSPAAQGGRS